MVNAAVIGQGGGGNRVSAAGDGEEDGESGRLRQGEARDGVSASVGCGCSHA